MAPDEDTEDPDAAPASPESRPSSRGDARDVNAGNGVRSATPGTAANAPMAPVPAVPELPTEPAVTAGPGALVGGVFGQVVSVAAEQVARYVHPEAAVVVASEFTFPLALALAVLAFLVVQHRVDRRDPKLRIAPQHIVETLVQFQGEDQL
jgi:hypothetical protein